MLGNITVRVVVVLAIAACIFCVIIDHANSDEETGADAKEDKKSK